MDVKRVTTIKHCDSLNATGGTLTRGEASMMVTERAHTALALMIASIFVLFLCGVSQAGECRMVPIKRIQCVRGTVVDGSGARISNARVTILRGGTEIVSTRTNADGKFSFERLEAGDYEIQVKTNSFNTARSPIVVVAPTRKCKWTLQIVLGFGVECDTGITAVKSRRTD